MTIVDGILILLAPLLALAVVSELAQRRVPSGLVPAVLATGLTLQTISFGPDGLLFSLGGAAVGFMLLLPFGVLSGSGTADARLLAAAGSFLGPWGAVLAGAAALGSMAVLGLTCLAWRAIRPVIGSRIPASHTGPNDPDPATVYRLPFSVGVAAGVLAASTVLVRSDIPDTLSTGLSTW